MHDARVFITSKRDKPMERILARVDVNQDDLAEAIGRVESLEIESINDDLRFTIYADGDEDDSIHIFVNRGDFAAKLFDAIVDTEHR